MHEQYRSCIEACFDCAAECEHCATACLQEPDAAARSRCVQLLRDCADACVLSAQYMSRGSTFAAAICGLCANVCDACATECGRFQDEHCQKCAAACRKCAEECRAMGRVPAGVR